MTPLLRIEVGPAIWRRFTRPATDEDIHSTEWIHLLADNGVRIFPSLDPACPPTAIRAFGEDGSMRDLSRVAAV